MTDRACERMSSGLKEPSVFVRSRRQRQRRSLRGGAPAEGECGRIFPRRVEGWKRDPMGESRVALRQDAGVDFHPHEEVSNV